MDIAAEHRARAAEDCAKATAIPLPGVRALHLRAAEARDEGGVRDRAAGGE